MADALRWIATVTYVTVAGPTWVAFHFEVLY